MIISKKPGKLTSFCMTVSMIVLLAILLMFAAGQTNAAYAGSNVVIVDSTYMDWDDFQDWAEDSGRDNEGIHQVKLLRNYTVDEWGEDDTDLRANMCFDLQGHTLSGENDDHLFQTDRSGIYLKFMNGTLEGFADDDQDGAIVGIYDDNMQLYLENVKIYGCTADRGGAIYIDADNTKVYTDKAYIYNNYTDDYAGAIYVDGKNNLISMKNSQILANYSDGCGGAIYIQGDTGNVVDGNNSTEIYSNSCDDDGGAIYLDHNGCTVKNLKLYKNAAEGGHNGGAIYSRCEQTTLADLEITENSAHRGGGIFIYNDYTTLDNVYITKNSCSMTGSGVYVDYDVDKGLNIDGKSQIFDNGHNGSTDNLYMSDDDPEDSHVNTLNLTSGANVHIGYYNPENSIQVSERTGNHNVEYLTCDNEGYMFKEGAGGHLMMYVADAYFPVKVDGVDYTRAQFIDWGEDKSGNGKHTVSLNGDMDTYDTIWFKDGCNIDLYLNGHMIRRMDKDDSVISIKSGGSDTYVNVYGGDKSISHTCGMFNQDDSRTTTNETVYGGLITGGEGDNDGGAFNLSGENCNLTLNDVTLAGNSADDYGGAIYLNSAKEKVKLINCTVKGNWAENHGGAVYINDDKCKLELDNTTIDSNWTGGDGGGIVTSEFNAEALIIRGKNDSKIRNNKCESDGGGIFLGNDNISVIGLEISGNHADDKGGGLYSMEETISITNSDFTGNTAYRGGGIYIANDVTTIKGCNITDNNAEFTGDGVYVEDYIDYGFNVTGKTVIKDNDGNGMSSNLYMSDDNGSSSRVGIEGLMSGSEVHIGYYDPHDGMMVSQSPGTYDTRYVICDNDNMHFEWDRSSRNLYMVKGPNPSPGEDKTEVAAGKASEAGAYGDYKLLQGYLEHGDSLDATLDTDVKFFYSDGFFDDSCKPETYDDHLATASLEMAMSSINTSYGGTGNYKGKHEAIRQFLADIGCDDQDIYVNDFYTEKPTTKSIGVAIAKKKLEKADGKETGKILIPVAIRSAAYELEWVNNAWLGTTGEAAGFSSAAATAMNELEKYIAKNKLEEELKKGNVTFWIAGYSRGGATANILAKRVIDKYGDNNRIYSYTWATPLGGEQGKNSRKYYSIHNCLNYADLVTLVAPSRLGFERYGVDHYVPGTEAGEPENYSDEEKNTCVADNKPLITKTSEYKSQRDKMLKQLNMVDSSKMFDDYFYPAYIPSLLPAAWNYSIIRPGGNGDVTAERFERDLINALQKNTDGFKSRKEYADTVFTLNSKSYNTAEGAVSDILGLIFSGDGMDDFIGDVSMAQSYIDFVWSDGITLQDIYDDLLGDWHELDEKTKETRTKDLWNVIKETGALEHLTNDQRTAFEINFPVLLNLILQFEDGDYYQKFSKYGTEGYAELAATGAYNLGRLVPNHYSEVYLAWARTYDDLYNGETKEFKIVAPEKIYKPTAKVVKRAMPGSTAPPEYKKMSADKVNILKGDTKVILDADNSDAKEGQSTSGEAIYYTLKNEKNGVTSAEQIYRGGVDLILDNSEGSEYTLTARAMQYNKESESETFRFKVEDPRHKIKVDDKDLFYDEGVSAAAVADAKEGKVFNHWDVAMTGIGTDETRTLDLTGSDDEAVRVAKMMFGNDYSSEIFTKETLPFITPVVDDKVLSYKDYNNYELVFKPVYADRISSITVTDIMSGDTAMLPAAGHNLPDSIVFSGDAGEMGVRTNVTDNIQWSYEYKGSSISASGKAYNNTEYTATVVLKQNEKEAFLLADKITTGDIDFAEGIEGVTVNSVSRNSADGSLTVSFTFPETEEGDQEKPESLRKLELTAFDLNSKTELEESQELTIVEGGITTITAPAVSNEVFENWDIDKSTISVPAEDVNKQTITFTVPEGTTEKYKLVANYRPVVETMNITLGEDGKAPVGGEVLPEIGDVSIKITNTYGLDPNDFDLTWTPNAVEDGKADYSTAYTATVKLAPKSDKGIHVISINGIKTDQYVAGYFIYGDNAEAMINGKAASLNKTANILTYTFPATDIQKRNLISINRPADIYDVARGTNINAQLPETTRVTVEGDDESMPEIEQIVPITWKDMEPVSGSGLEPRTWRVNGTLEPLPENIINEPKVDTDFSIMVYVRGAAIADSPVASVDSGVFHNSFSVDLSTNDGSTIYYTLDGSQPTSKSTKYDGRPIAITRDGKPGSKVTLNAIAVKSQCIDSTVSTYVYEFDNHVAIPSGNNFAYDGEMHTGVFGSEFYTLEAEDEALVIDEKTGNVITNIAGKYNVTAKIKPGYEWIVGTDDDGKEVTDTADKVIEFKVADSLEIYMNEIAEMLETMNSDISKMDDNWKSDSRLDEEVTEKYRKAYTRINNKYEQLCNDTTEGEISKDDLIETAKEIKNEAQDINSIAGNILSMAVSITNLNAELDNQKQQLDIIESYISEGRDKDEIKDKLAVIKNDIRQLERNRSNIITLVPCFGERASELIERADMLLKATGGLINIRIDEADSVRFFKIADSNAKYVKGKTIATFAEGLGTTEADVTEDTSFSGMNLTVDDNETQNVSAEYAGLLAGDSVKTASYKIFVGNYYAIGTNSAGEISKDYELDFTKNDNIPTLTGEFKAGEVFKVYGSKGTGSALSLGFENLTDDSDNVSNTNGSICTAVTGTYTLKIIPDERGELKLSVKLIKTHVTGELAIKGQPEYGSILSAEFISGNPDDQTGEFQWYVNNRKVEGATGKTYTPEAADIGFPVKVVFRGAGDYYGDLTAKSEGNIEKRIVTVSGITAKDKNYDGKKDAELNMSEILFEGICDGDKLDIKADAYFEDANAGENKNVIITNPELTGKAAKCYEIDIEKSQNSAKASIFKSAPKLCGGIEVTETATGYPYILKTEYKGDGILTFSSSDSSIATIDNEGNIKVLNKGTVTFRIELSETSNYKSDYKEITTDVARKQDAAFKVKSLKYTIALNNKSLNIAVTEKKPVDGKIFYRSSNANIAKVDSKGRIKPVNVGKTTIIVSIPETENYYSVSKKITVKVVPNSKQIKLIRKNRKVLVVRWFKAKKNQRKNITGYQLKYSTNAKFKKYAKSVIIKNNKAKGKVIKLLKKNRKYYFKLRVYKTVKGVTYCSNWSAVKSMKM